MSERPGGKSSANWKFQMRPNNYDDTFLIIVELAVSAEWQSEKVQKMLNTYYDVQKVLYVFIAIVGVPVNLLAILILSRGNCGLSTCTTRYLVAMATADLLVIITEVILLQINYYYFPVSFLDITPVCIIIRILPRAATDCSVWFTVTFTFDRYITICCQKLKITYCTGRTATVVLVTAGTFLTLKSIPFYFAYGPREIIDDIPWFCRWKPSYFTEPGWVGFDWFDTVLTPLLPFSVILLLNALTVRHILVASRVRKGLRGQSNGENRTDPEMESRRRSVVLLFTLSGSFILLWLTSVLFFMYYQITGLEWTDAEFIFLQMGTLLQNFSCCTNTFIYAVTQSKFRKQVKALLKNTVTSLLLITHKP
ncbi:probable G-protein coupled receptor 139 [Hypanus sabinus]|uniref:probable G-protein coupled receptor 139 n=1 Tax=Hypanus sabinus TaxID=79690 RepID=UPI0028C46C19|nr:probable G-protein coupled receptor 139 [Hypanus sabinus]